MAPRRTFVAICGLLLACSFFTTATAQKFNHNSYVGKEPPELVSRTVHWLGWQEKVILKDLKGKVVWLQFNFCENCTSLRAHLARWEEQYAADGLFVIEINQSVGDPLHVMRRMIETKNLKHPVLWDDDCRNTKAYGIKTWPFVYLIGADRKVFWEGNPSRWIRRPKRVKEMRALIERKLSEENRPPSLVSALSGARTAVHPHSQAVAHCIPGKRR